MPGRHEADRYIADLMMCAQVRRLKRASAGCAIAHLHDRDGLRRRKDVCVAGAGVVGMAVSDQRAINRTRRVDVEIACFAVEALRCRIEPVLDRTHWMKT
jgi:hypothetical protein